MRHIPEIFASVVLLALLQGCSRVDPVVNGITFAPDVASTKGLLNASGLNQSGTKIQVYDYISGFNGTVGNTTVTSSQTVKYFSDLIAYNGAAIWPYWNASTQAPDATIAYPWTKTGTHSFFGWLYEDGTSPGIAASDLFGSGQPSFNESTRVLSFPTTTMSKASPQFDFSYSGVISVDAATHTTGAVQMPLDHLFSALKLTLINTSGNTIMLKSVTLRGMKNRRSATIDFSADTPSVATDNLSSVDVPIFVSGSENGTEYPNLDHEIQLADFFLMWPQSYSELDGATLDVVYFIKDVNDVVSDELSASMDLDNLIIFKTDSTGMVAGTKYTFMLQFKESTLDIYVRVLPWEYEAYDWDYSNRSISARSGMPKDGVLAFYRWNSTTSAYDVQPTTDEWSAKTLRFTTRQEVLTGRFYIESPTSGRWQVTAYPASAASYFIVSPTSGDIDVYTDNGLAEFTVRVNPDATPTSTQTLYFNVSMFFNGDWHDANSEFNRKNIKLVLDAN